MQDCEPTGIDPYEEDSEADELPDFVYAILFGIAAVICFFAAPIAWLKR